MKFKVLVPSLALTLAALIVPMAHSIRALEAPRRIDIVARRFGFTPGDVTVKQGQPVTIVLTSQDVAHGLKFKDLNVDINVKKGETKEVTFTPNKAGTFTGQCSVFCGSGHGSMKMTLHVTE